MPHCYDSFQHLDTAAKGAGRQVNMVTGWETGKYGDWLQAGQLRDFESVPRSS